MSANDEVHSDGVGAATSRPGATIPTDTAQSTMTNGLSGDQPAAEAEHAQASASPSDGASGQVSPDAAMVGSDDSAESSAPPVPPGPSGPTDAAGSDSTPPGGAGQQAGPTEEHLGIGAPYPTTNQQPRPGQPPAQQPPRVQPGQQQPGGNSQAWRSADRPVPGRATGSPPGQPQAGTWASRPDASPPASPAARRRGGESPLAEWQSSPPNVARRTNPAQTTGQSPAVSAGGPAPSGQPQAAQAQAGAQQSPTPGGAAYGGSASGQPGLPETNHWDDDPIGEQARRLAPKYGVRGAIYRITKLNLGATRRDLDELEIRERLNRQTRRTRGYCGYIGIGSEKGGVGKTTLASLLAAEIAEGRRESVGIADLNPDLGTLPDRFGVRPHYSIRDLLAHVDEIPWRYHVHDFMEKVPEMNVRVLAASTDRKIRHQLSVADVELLAELFAPFFSFAILDNGTHITHEAMLGTLRTAHGLVLVTDNTRDGANLARKTLQFLTDNGYPEMRRRAVVAVVAKETASPIKVRAIEKAFRDHVRDLVVVPYDAALDGGGKIPFRDPNAVNKLLRKETRMAVRRLAAIVMDDLVS